MFKAKTKNLKNGKTANFSSTYWHSTVFSIYFKTFINIFKKKIVKKKLAYKKNYPLLISGQGGYPESNRELTVPHTVVLPIELYPPSYVGVIRTPISKYQKFMTYH